MNGSGAESTAIRREFLAAARSALGSAPAPKAGAPESVERIDDDTQGLDPYASLGAWGQG